MDGFLLLAFLFLVAGVIAVPIASRLGLGSVLGYLLVPYATLAELKTLDIGYGYTADGGKTYPFKGAEYIPQVRQLSQGKTG